MACIPTFFRLTTAFLLLGIVVRGGTPSKDIQAAERDTNVPIVIGATDTFYPYSFRDDKGRMTGFAVELSDAVAKAVGLSFQRRIVPSTGMAEALRSDTINVIQIWAETSERRAWAAFSVPILRFETICMVRKGEQRIQKLEDLVGKRVAVGQRGTAADVYMRAKHPKAILVYTDTSESFLQALSKGEVDAAVLSRLTAIAASERLGLRNLKILDDKVQGYDVRYCFAVRGDDSLLLARLNEGLAIVHRNGEYDEIYRRWFGRYERRSFTTSEVLGYLIIALGLGCGAALWGFWRQRILSRRIANQAAELNEQRSLLAALYEKHPLATIVFEIGGGQAPGVASLNTGACRLFGLGPEATGMPLMELPLAIHWRDFLRDVCNRDVTEASAQFESKIDETRQLIETIVVPLGRGSNGRERICVLLADVTGKRLMDEEIAQSRRLRALGELVGGIAHEFNNMLTPVMATVGILKLDHPNDPVLQEDLAIISKAASNASALTRRLLTFGRKGDDRAQGVNLSDTINSCASLVRPTLDRRIELILHIPQGLPPLFFNPTDLNQIIFNLVINARDTLMDKLSKPYPQGWVPRITINIEEIPLESCPPNAKTGRCVRAWQKLSVQDNGLGIDPKNRDRIFEPFFTTKEVGKGTGLGLATVWHLISDVGGDIDVDSVLGEGTTFHVTIPRWDVENAPEASKIQAPQKPAESDNGRVLLADDEDLVLRSITPVLQRMGHEVETCTDGAAAWELFMRERGQFQVLLLDVNMPKMNGIDFLNLVRGTSFSGRIVVMSGRLTDEDMQALRELRVERVLQKPFTTEELIESLQG